MRRSPSRNKGGNNLFHEFSSASVIEISVLNCGRTPVFALVGAGRRDSAGTELRSRLPGDNAEFGVLGNRPLLCARNGRRRRLRGHSELFSRIEGSLQIRKVQRRSWKERGWRCLSVTAGWSTTPVTKHPEQWFGGAGKIATGLTAGEISWMRGRTGGARFTGVSASLKVVSGKSGRGMTDTQTAAANRNRTNVKRNRIASLHRDQQPRSIDPSS